MSCGAGTSRTSGACSRGCSCALGTVPPRRPPIGASRASPSNEDPDLLALYFEFGRYLLDLEFEAWRSACEPAGHLERGPASCLEQQVDDQHQSGDELLAGGHRRPVGDAAAAVADDPRSAGDRRRDREGALRRQGLGAPPQHRSVAGDDARGRRLGALADGAGLAGQPDVGSLRVQRRSRLPAPRRVPGDEGSRAVRPRHPGPGAGRRPLCRAAGHQSLDVTGEPVRPQRQAGASDLRSHDGHRTRSRAVREQRAGGGRSRRGRRVPLRTATDGRAPAAVADRRARAVAGVDRGLSRSRARPPARVAPILALPGTRDRPRSARRTSPPRRGSPSNCAAMAGLAGQRRGRSRSGRDSGTPSTRTTT